MDTSLPSTITAGTTIEYTRSAPDYPAPTWTLSLLIQGASKLVIAATPSGSDHLVTISAAESGTLAAGVYKYYEQVTDGTIVKNLTELPQSLEVLPDFLAAAAGDLQDVAEKNLLAIRAVMSGKYSDDLKSYEIGGRAIVTFTHAELIQAESYWASRVNALKPGRAGRFDTNVRAQITGSLRA